VLLRLVGVVALLTVSSLAWWLWQRRDGHVRGVTGAAPRHGEHRVAAELPGIAHLELDAEAHHELTRRFGVLRTPTILLADHAGDVVGKISGAPTTAQALDALGAVAE
jgi:hypothetical protein